MRLTMALIYDSEPACTLPKQLNGTEPLPIIMLFTPVLIFL